MTPGGGGLLPIPGESDLSDGILLAGGGQEFGKDKGGVGEYDKDPQQVGGGAAGVRIFL